MIFKLIDKILLKIFFDHDLKVEKADFQSRILEYDKFYKSIDFKKCFGFVINKFISYFNRLAESEVNE